VSLLPHLRLKKINSLPQTKFFKGLHSALALLEKITQEILFRNAIVGLEKSCRKLMFLLRRD